MTTRCVQSRGVLYIFCFFAFLFISCLVQSFSSTYFIPRPYESENRELTQLL